MAHQDTFKCERKIHRKGRQKERGTGTVIIHVSSSTTRVCTGQQSTNNRIGWNEIERGIRRRKPTVTQEERLRSTRSIVQANVWQRVSAHDLKVSIKFASAA